MKTISLLLIWLTCHASLFGARTNLVESLFASGSEGWEMVDLPDGSAFSAPVTNKPLSWTNSPAPIGSNVYISDASSGTIFFAAPPHFVSRLGDVYGSFLEFELSTTHQTWIDSDVMVIRGTNQSGSWAAVGSLPRVPGREWTAYSIRLVAANFRWAAKGGAVIAPRDFRVLLRTATALWLPAEFGSGQVETTRLRHARIEAEPFLGIQCVPSVTLDGFQGQMFRIEFRDILGIQGWLPLTNITLGATPFVFVDTSAVDAGQRFYRAIEISLP